MIIENKKSLGKLIHFHRKKAKLSRIELAEIAGLGKTVIYDIENGIKNVRIETLNQILKTLNITVLFTSPLIEEFKQSINAKN